MVADIIMRDFIIGTAGHIDHGKTTLIKALTGTNTDRLKEEQQRGITIDIGFASMLQDDYRIGFIDVPGHERFVKNMLAGIGGIELVLLIVAADESVMPQTVEHFQICRLLEVPRGVIVVTKKSSVEEDFLALVEEDVRSLTKGSFLERAPLVAVDSLTGEGIDRLKKVLVSELESLPDQSASASQKIFRFPIDRVFSLPGFGTIVTGTPHCGTLQKSSALAVYPSGKVGKVRNIEVFGQTEDLARSGQRTALNLSGFDREDLERGMVLAPPSTFEPSYMFDTFLSVLPDAPMVLKHRSPIRFHHGSGEIIGRLYLVQGQELRQGQSGLVQLRLDRPAVACPPDHFVLRRYSPMTTIAGGIILDNKPVKLSRKKIRKSAPRLLHLQQLWRQGNGSFTKALLEQIVWSKQEQGTTLPELVSRTGLAPHHIAAEIGSIGEIVLVPKEPLLAASREIFSGLKSQVVEFLESYHRSNPLAVGVSLEELKSRVLKSARSPFFQALLDSLREEGKVEISGATVAAHGRRIVLTKRQEELRDKLLSRFDHRTLQPPSLEDLLRASDDSQETRKIFFYLIQTGELVRITDSLVLSARQTSLLETTLRSHFSSGETFGIAEFKELFGITRKYAIPLLEFLDQLRITRRTGDQRVML